MRKSICTACLALLVLASANFAAAQSADDKAIAQQIGRGLKDSGQLRDYRIGVKYQQGVAWLSGSVTNEQQLGTAMRLTQGMPGVKRVVNNLSIAGAPASGNHMKTMELGQQLQQVSAQSVGTMNNARPRVNQAYMPPQAGPQQRGVQMPPQNYRSMASRPMPARPMQARPMPQQMPNQMMANRQMGPGGQMGPSRPMGPMGPGPGGPMGPGGPGGPMQAGCNCDGGPAYGGGGGGGMMMGGGGGPSAMGYVPGGYGGAASYDNASMPGYAWPSYASYPNYAALTYPRQYSPTAWPYIGPFYPYPQVPLGWRKVALEWDDGWWFLDFSDCGSNH